MPTEPLTETPGRAPTQPVQQPRSKPVPLLQANGLSGDVHEFNRRVEAAFHAHQQAFGTRPSPHLAYDLVRSSVPAQDFQKLFAVKSAQHAEAVKALANTNPHRDILDGLKQAVADHKLASFMHDNADQIKSLSDDPAFAKQVYPILSKGISEGYKSGDFNTAGIPLAGVNHLLTLGASQVANSLVHAPGALYGLGKTIVKGDIGVITGDDRKIGEANKEFGAVVKGSVASVKQDFRHPSDRPGFLFLDLLGLAAPATRLAAGGRALAAGEGLNAAELAVTKKAGGTFAIGREGAKENVLLSENPFVAAAQRYRLEHRQAKLDLTTANGEKQPSGLLSILAPNSAKDFLDEHFSFASKIGREADARRRVEHIVDTANNRELDHLTGSALAEARVFSRIPSKLRKGLTRGEQKAIQTLSFGVSPDEQIAFHERMIAGGVGDASAHMRQIADLKLATKILENPNPRGRFKEALALTQQVVAEMERKKVDELGLSPVTRESRIGKPAATVEGEAATQVFPATGPVEPFYTKLEPRGKQKRPPSDRVGFYAAKPGPFGIPAPTTPAELTHEFTGKSITAGDFRIDATNLTSEAYGRTVRAATVLNEHSRLWKSATDTPKTRFDIPIRDSKTIPDKLRSILGNMDEGVMTDKEAALLPTDMRALIDELYPPLERAQREKIEGVKWIDGRTIGAANEIPARPGAFVKGAEMANELVRVPILFLRPAYALNALGNAGMLAFHQGFSAVPNMAWALNAKAHLGEEGLRTANALMGQGRSKSYTTAITPKLSRGLAQAWNTVTDERFRLASFRDEAVRLGYKTDEDMRGLLRDGGKDLVEIKRRANKAMVEFDNLSPFEKNTLRHIIFVYPWVSRSAVYTLRSVMEHPGKVDVLAHLGQQEIDDPVFKNAPEWFKRTGYFPVGWTADGKPKVVNPTSVNSFSTLGELTAVLGGGFGGTKYAAFQDLLGPLPSLAIHGITGKDQYGNDYPDGDWIGAAKEALGSLPQVSAVARASKKNPTAKTVDQASRSSIVAGFHSALKRTVFTPGWLDGYGSLLAGGLSERGVDLPALEARYWRDATPEQRHQNELSLLDSALTIQAGLLKASVPDAVRKGVTVGSDIDFAYKTFATNTGRPPTPKERAGLLIDHLEAKGLLPDGQAAKYKTQLAPLISEQDINHLRNIVFGKYGGGDALRQWDDDVRLVASFKKPVFDQKTAALHKQGLASSPRPNVSQDALYEYGRKYLTFTRKVAGIQEQIKQGDSTTADLRAFEDANDKPVYAGRRPSMTTLQGANPGMLAKGNIDIANRPVASNRDGSISTVRTISIGTDKGEVLIPTVVGGKVVSNDRAIAYYKKTGENLGTFKSAAAANAYSVRLHNEQAKVYASGGALPSFVRTAWAYLPADQQKQAVASSAVTAWSALSSFEKELLGHKADAKITAGWAKLADVVGEQKAALARKGESFPAGYKRILAQYVQRYYDAPGLVKDFDFAREPLYARLKTYKPIRESPNAGKWTQLLGVAKTYSAYLKSPDYDNAQVRQMWRDYVANTVQPWVASDEAFADEIKGYGKNVLGRLIGG